MIFIRKNREGATGQVPFYHNESLTKIAGVENDVNPFMLSWEEVEASMHPIS